MVEGLYRHSSCLVVYSCLQWKLVLLLLNRGIVSGEIEHKESLNGKNKKFLKRP